MPYMELLEASSEEEDAPLGFNDSDED